VTDDAVLADGTPPATPMQLFEELRRLGIAFRTVEHPPVFTVEEAKATRGHLPGVHTKSLFLRDKRERMWLVVCLADRDVDLHAVAARLGSKRLSFGSPRRLMRFLGVIPGAVNPFAVINDKGGEVRVAIDRAVLEGDPVNLHPLDNSKTTAVAAADLVRFLEVHGHAPQVLDFDR
jgi:Ala-tRNA(Pro) deacylase